MPWHCLKTRFLHPSGFWFHSFFFLPARQSVFCRKVPGFLSHHQCCYPSVLGSLEKLRSRQNYSHTFVSGNTMPDGDFPARS